MKSGYSVMEIMKFLDVGSLLKIQLLCKRFYFQTVPEIMTIMNYTAILDTIPVIREVPVPIALLRSRVSALVENFSKNDADLLYKIIISEDKENDIKLSQIGQIPEIQGPQKSFERANQADHTEHENFGVSVI